MYLMKLSTYFLFTALSVASSAQAQLDSNAGKISLWKRSTSSNTALLDSAVFLPADYGSSENKLYPVVISLHGLGGSTLNTAHSAVGGNKSGFIKQVWGTPLAKTFPAIVIAPNRSAPGSTKSALWTHSRVRGVIEAALKKYQIDPNRIVATGYSAGSIATQELLKNSKDLIAAGMPGAYSTDFIASSPCSLADVPVWSFGNLSDPLFRYTTWDKIEPKVQACSNYVHEFRLTVYRSSCGHGCWDSHWAKKEVQEWLVSQSK
jgi:predicted peptidase